MKDILDADARGIVRAFARPDTLLGLDYDGTLAPIVDTPSAAGMRAETRVALARAAHALPTVVISGRARKDVAERLEGIPLRAVFGNHGMEGEGTDEADYRARTAAWHALLEPRSRRCRASGSRTRACRWPCTPAPPPIRSPPNAPSPPPWQRCPALV